VKHKTCIRIPSGETHSLIVDREVPAHALHAPLRDTVSQLMVWIDNHVEWKAGTEGPRVIKPIAGPGNFEIVMHDANTNCGLCG
jgi:hypothetical protein